MPWAWPLPRCQLTARMIYMSFRLGNLYKPSVFATGILGGGHTRYLHLFYCINHQHQSLQSSWFFFLFEPLRSADCLAPPSFFPPISGIKNTLKCPDPNDPNNKEKHSKLQFPAYISTPHLGLFCCCLRFPNMSTPVTPKKIPHAIPPVCGSFRL